MLDTRRVLFTDFRHAYRDAMDMIMTKIREMSRRSRIGGSITVVGESPAEGGGMA